MLKYFLFYKPYQVLCQFSPEGEKQTLMDYFPGLQKDIYPVGRLDFDSEGLLLLTNDKQLTHQLLEPKFAHSKTYWAQVEGEVTEKSLQQLRSGVVINISGKQYKTKPAQAIALKNEPDVPERNPPIRYRANIPTTWIALTITEGKNRQVRRMCAVVGFPVLRLVRNSIGKVNLNGLQPGEWIEATADVKTKLIH
ncbi:MAG: pseudouridine synthase [Sphingobacteriales bacterium]|nr:MAG: pseudouridine synthase [Sphingobacteriales bacterium]